MSKFLNTSPAVIRELLESVDTTGVSIDCRQLLESLQDLAERRDPRGDASHCQMKLCDLEDYFAYTLWDGYGDVELLLENGCLDEFQGNISPDELPGLIEEVLSYTPWEADAFCDCSAGNELLEQTIRKVFSDYINSKPFSFDSEVYFDDDHFNRWYGQLHASDFLLDKLQKKVQAKASTAILCMDPKPEFYANYDIIQGTVSVYSSFTVSLRSKKPQYSETLPLTSAEADLLIACMENACRKFYDGKDCLSVLNEMRVREGRSPIKQSLSGKIRFTQNIDETTSTRIQQLSDIGR